MKKNILAVILILIIVCTSAIAFSGCSLIAKVFGKTYISYVQSGAYTVGNLETDQMAEDFLIDWYGGSVNIMQYDGDKVIFTETANEDVDDDMKLHWAFWDSSEYGKYYQIQYCAKGFKDLSTIRKDLTVLIPAQVTELNKLSITVRQECDINIYLPNVSFVGECNGSPNVHLDAEQGNINAVFKNIDSFRMLGDGGDQANHYYRRLKAEKVGNIDFVNSFEKSIFFLKAVTGYATIKTFAGDIYILCDGHVHSLTTENTTGTTYIYADTFDQMDLTGRDMPIGVEVGIKQNFVAKMSNYTLYSRDIAYKEPKFIGRIAYVRDEDLKPDDPDDVYDIVRTGDEWRVHGGKNKYGKDVVVKVKTGADTYFGAAGGQALYTDMEYTGIFDNLPQDPFSDNGQSQN